MSTNGAYDKIDYLIIRELSKDARASAAQIGKVLDINERTVRRRINNLVDSGVVRIASIVSPTHFGYNAIADINLQVEDERYASFIEECKDNSNICYIATGWGKANLSIEVRFKDNKQLHDYINNVLPLVEGVTVINYFIIPDIIYNIDSWQPVEEDFE